MDGVQGASVSLEARLLFPRMVMRRGVTIFDAIVHVRFGRRSQRHVIQTGKPERFAQILIESVQLFQMLREGGNLASGRSAEEHLIPTIGQYTDFIADDDTFVIDLHLTGDRALRACIDVFDDRTESAAGDARSARTFAVHVESSGLQILNTLIEIELVRRDTAKEHSTIIPVPYDVPV